MKKNILYIIIVAMLSVSFIGCEKQTNLGILPPTRIGAEGTMSCLLEKEYGFESAFEDAEIVAHIKVGDWLSEDSEIGATFYAANIIKQYKGETLQDIVLKQDGYSKFTVENYPLFTHGNELLVFCKKATNTEYLNCYWIIGSFTTIFDAVTTSSGETYFMDRLGLIGDRTETRSDKAATSGHEETGIIVNYAQQTNLKATLEKNIVAEDPIVSDFGYTYPYIFSESDIVNWISEKIK